VGTVISVLGSTAVSVAFGFATAGADSSFAAFFSPTPAFIEFDDGLFGPAVPLANEMLVFRCGSGMLLSPLVLSLSASALVSLLSVAAVAETSVLLLSGTTAAFAVSSAFAARAAISAAPGNA
jgi:hypothetical protein